MSNSLTEIENSIRLSILSGQFLLSLTQDPAVTAEAMRGIAELCPQIAHRNKKIGVTMSTYQFKVSIKYTKPLVWRRIVVPDRITFHQLHLVLQEAFSWNNYHLYQFTLPGIDLPIRRHYSDPYLNEDVLCDGRDEYIDAYMTIGLRFLYEYDFGDGWEHTLELEKIHLDDNTRYPIITKYVGDSLVEDCGGVGGYERLLEVLGNPNDPEYSSMKSWADLQGMEKFSLEYTNRVMEETLHFPLEN